MRVAPAQAPTKLSLTKRSRTPGSDLDEDGKELSECTALEEPSHYRLHGYGGGVVVVAPLDTPWALARRISFTSPTSQCRPLTRDAQTVPCPVQVLPGATTARQAHSKIGQVVGPLVGTERSALLSGPRAGIPDDLEAQTRHARVLKARGVEEGAASIPIAQRRERQVLQ